MNLAGKTVLLTRRAEQSAPLTNLLERLGATVVSFPVLTFAEPGSWVECDEALMNLRAWDAILLTSANAVQALVRRAIEIGVPLKDLRSKQVYAIGPSTRSAVESEGITPVRAPEFGSAETMATHLIAAGVTGKKFLFPCSDIAREELPSRLREAGAEVERVVVYRTVTPPEDRAEHVRALFRHGSVDVLIFASPSAVHNFVELVGVELMRGTSLTPVVAAIGPTTADAVRKHGFVPHVVAGVPDAASLVQALVEYDLRVAE